MTEERFILTGVAMPPSSRLCLSFVLTFFLCGNFSLSLADTQRIVDYHYDGAGNITDIRSDRNFGPPAVTALQPGFIHKESRAFVTATGSNLFHAKVTTTTPGLEVLEYTAVSATQLQLTLEADDTAVIGLGVLTFTTRLGSDTKTIAIADRTPIISTVPNPIILAADGQGIEVKLIFDQPLATDQVYDLAIRNNSIASVSAQSITLIAGATQVSTTVVGLSTGNTQLEINQLSNFLALGIPVIVTDNQLPPAPYSFYAEPVGVAAYVKPSIQASGIFTTKDALGVAVYLEPSLTTTGIFSTPTPLGVATYLEPTLSTSGLFVSPKPLGMAYGTVVSNVNPTSVPVNTSATLILDGFELDAVTAVAFEPDDGITQTTTFTVNTQGTQLQIPISIASGASQVARVLILTTPTGDQLFSDGVIQITN